MTTLTSSEIDTALDDLIATHFKGSMQDLLDHLYKRVSYASEAASMHYYAYADEMTYILDSMVDSEEITEDEKVELEKQIINQPRYACDHYVDASDNNYLREMENEASAEAVKEMRDALKRMSMI